MAVDDKKTQLGAPIRSAPPRAGATGAQPVATPTPAPQGSHAPVEPELAARVDATMAAGTPAPGHTPPADPLVGQTLAGRYLIQRKLGEGGMGAVYLAQHTVLEKQIALKLLHGEFARKPDLVERFMQEAKAASRIRHENVIDISDFGSTGDGLVFFAMELLSGHDLHQEVVRARKAGERLPWSRSRGIFLQICSALAAAHAHGIVHRDLKPENIFLVERLGNRDFVKLLDFGIAKLTETADGDRKLTRTGMLFGTPEYMSPEQARGESVDHRVDIYAMGCILYQLCTGRVPFEAENFMGILSQHLTDPPPPIDPAILEEIGAPPELDAIVMRALAKNRDERWQTIDELASAIRALDGDVDPTRIPTQPPRVATQPPRATRPAAAEATAAGWTGRFEIPIDGAPARAAKPIWPWLLAAGVVVAGGVAAFVATRGRGAPPAATVAASPPVPVAPPATADTSPLPAQVTIKLDSRPQGADIYDHTSKEVVGQTPFDFSLPGSREPRRFTFRLKGHSGKMIELLPVEDVAFTAELVALGSAAAAATVEAVEVVPQKSRAGRRPGAADKPAVATPSVSPPGAMPAAVESSPVEGATKPAETKPVETRPVDSNPAAPPPKPGDGSAADKPTDGAAGEKPVANPPAEKPVAEKPAEKPAVDKTRPAKPKDKPPGDKPDDEMPILKDPFKGGAGPDATGSP